MGNRIREFRNRRNLSQERLGELVHSGRSTIVKLEMGKMKLTEAWMRRLAPVLNCAPEDLIGEAETVPLTWTVASAFSEGRPERFGRSPPHRRIHAPPGLKDPADCFCADVVDDSADGIYPRGSLLFCRRVEGGTARIPLRAKIIVRRLGGDPGADDAMEVLAGALDRSLTGDLLLRTFSSDREVAGSVLIQPVALPAGRFAEAPLGLDELKAPIDYQARDDDPAQILGIVVMATTPQQPV